MIEQTTPLVEYARSGIDIDGIVSSQLLINIFEKNTPLHDGAVIIKGNRIVSATSYLPLSSSRLDKNLGTRHRAGMGISEETDALTLIVSEETGFISYTYKGQLWNKVTPEELRGALIRLQNKLSEEEVKNRNNARSAFRSISDLGWQALRRSRSGSGTSGAGKPSGDAPGPPETSKEPVSTGEEGGAHD